MKEELDAEVVEVEAEEMVEETVKEAVEEKVVVRAGQWLRGFLGRGRRGPYRTCHGTRPSWLASTPQTWTTPGDCPPGESGLDSPCFDAAGA